MSPDSRSWRDKLGDTGYLLKHSFSVVTDDRDILTPAIRMVLYSAFLTTLLFGSVFAFYIGYVGTGLLMILLLLILGIYKFFYYTYQRSAQSWIVYNAIRGGDVSYKEGIDHARGEAGQLRWVAIIDLFMGYIKGTQSEKSSSGGIISAIAKILVKIFFAALLEVWDLVKHYMIPAITIEEKGYKEMLSDMKDLRDNVPATLTGVFGIDFAGRIVYSLITPLYFVFMGLGVLFGWLLRDVFSASAVSISGFSFSWVPVAIALFLVVLGGNIMKRIVESTKMIYFTIFYMMIRRPMEIEESRKAELVRYLKFGEAGEEPQRSSQTRDPFQGMNGERREYMRELVDYIDRYMGQGYTKDDIIQFLVDEGHREQDVEEAFRIWQEHRT